MSASKKIFMEQREREEYIRRAAEETHLNEMENFVSAKDNSNNNNNSKNQNKMETTKKLSEQQLADLKKPLAAEAVKPHPTKNYLSTIKAIFVIERFNEVFGLGGWWINNEVVEAGEKHIVVKSTFHAPAFGITVPDIFGGNDNPDRGDAYKGACTDALTKIGSYLFVGMEVFKGHAATTSNGNGAAKETEVKKIYPEDNRAWLSEAQKNKVAERIKAGDTESFAACEKAFKMKKEYREELKKLLN